MLSVVIGIWSVTVVVAAGDMGQAVLSQVVEESLGRPATVSISATQLPAGVSVAQWRARLAQLMRRYDTPQSSPSETTHATASSGGRSGALLLDGVTPAFDNVRLLPVTMGRWLVSSDATMEAPSVVLDERAVADLGFASPSAAIGSIIHLGMLQPVVARVVGVVQDQAQDGATVYLPVQLLERYGSPVGSSLSNSYLVHVPPAQVEVLVAMLKSNLGAWGFSNGLTIQRVDQAQSLNSGLLAIQLVLAGIAGIALVTGGIGVLNLGLVTVRERIHELGIRRAFGATRGFLFLMVLVESITTTVVAGIVGVGLAIVTVVIFLPGLLSGLDGSVQTSASFPLLAPVIGFALSCTLGVTAGTVPAVRGSRTSVIAALQRQ